MKAIVSLVGVLALFSAAPVPARSGIIVDFDAISASGQPSGVGGATLDNYLAGFGITLTGVTPGTQVVVYNQDSIFTASQPVVAPSAPNILAQIGSIDPVQYALTFSVLQDSFSLTRTGFHPDSFGLALPEWKATAYDSHGNSLGSVGENAFSIFSDLPSQTFTLVGPDIERVVVASDNHHFAAFGTVLIDDLNLSNVAMPSPAPSTFVMAICAGITLAATRLWKFRRSGCA